MDNPRENGLSKIESIDAINEVDSSMKTEKEGTMVRKNKGVDLSQARVSKTEEAKECANDDSDSMHRKDLSLSPPFIL